MTTVYLDCQYGISGDMTLASLINLGADPIYIQKELQKLSLDEFELGVIIQNEKGIQGNRLKLEFIKPLEETDFKKFITHETAEDHNHAETPGHHNHRHAAEIFSLIESSELAPRVKERSLSIFREIARAEGKIHGMPMEDVHFHEVGAMDSIIDVIGVCLALEDLDVSEVIFSEIPTGFGRLKMAHGLYPIPAPATAEILVSVPISAYSVEGEMTTPTGASFAKVLANSYGPLPPGEIIKIGYGIGTKVFSHPNVLRTFLIKKKITK